MPLIPAWEPIEIDFSVFCDFLQFCPIKTQMKNVLLHI